MSAVEPRCDDWETFVKDQDRTFFPGYNLGGAWNVPVVMKNWDPLVFFPALAMERRPGLLCFSWKFSSGLGEPDQETIRTEYTHVS